MSWEGDDAVSHRNQLRVRLRELIALFRVRLAHLPPGAVLPSESAIQGVVVPGTYARRCGEKARGWAVP